MRLARLSVLIGCASSLVFVLPHLAFDLTSPGSVAFFPVLMIGWPLQPFVGALGLLIGPLFLTWYGGFLRATHTPLPAALTAFLVWAAFFTCMAYSWLSRRGSASGEASSTARSSLRAWATILLGLSAILVVSEGFWGAEGCKSGGPKGGEGSIVLMMCTLLIQLAWMSAYGIHVVIESRRSRSLRR